MGRRCLPSLPSSSLLSLAAFIFLAFSQISPVVDGDVLPSSITPINRDLYHSSDALMKRIEALVRRHPDRLSFRTLTSGNKGYHAKLTVVTYSHSGVKDIKSKFRILLSFGQHGRELITSELAMRILSILTEEQSLPHLDLISLNHTLQKLVIKVVPMENLNGRKLVEAGKLCERRNGRGVDLNRNWSVDWGKKEKDYDPLEESPGTAPFSEPETQMMRKLSISFDPHLWINVHSGMEALFMPYDHKNSTPDGLPSQKSKLMLEELNSLHCHNHCMVGSGGGSVGYLAHGTATDYMHDIARVPMAFTFEVYGDETASPADCFKMFNPVNLTTYTRVLNDWSAAFFTVFKIAPQRLNESHDKMLAFKSGKWVSTDEYIKGYLMERSSRDGKKMEMLDLGMQEMRTYFRLFLLSSVLLLFMFCSRISRSKYSVPTVLG